MSSMSFLFNKNGIVKPATTAELSSKILLLKPLTRPSVVLRPQTSCLKLSHYARQCRVKFSSSSAAADQILNREPPADNFEHDIMPEKEKLGLVVKPNEKPRLVLKFIWMKNDVVVALDQVIPGHGTIPLSPYYFWPRKDAWKELKVLLESKPWIFQMERIRLLNQATDVINLWQASGGNL